jgi:hypothetical protein
MPRHVIVRTHEIRRHSIRHYGARADATNTDGAPSAANVFAALNGLRVALSLTMPLRFTPCLVQPIPRLII